MKPPHFLTPCAPRQLLGPATEQLRAAGVDGAARDARILMAHAMGIAPGRLIVEQGRELTAEEISRFMAAIAARADRQPVSQIIGKRTFHGHEFVVTRAVLDPRPETETLVEQALAVPFSRVLDLGTGSGAIILSLLAERLDATGLGVDQSRAALEVAGRNVARMGLGARVELCLSDWFSDVSGQFDLIVSNPPYISAAELETLAPELRDWEPRGALVPEGDAGDGMAAYRIITAEALRYLESGGWLMVEIGAGQGQDVADLFATAGFKDVSVVSDLDARPRVVCGHKPDN